MKMVIKNIKTILLAITMILSILIGLVLFLCEVTDENISETNWIIKLILIKIVSYALMYIGYKIYYNNFK